MIRVYNKQTKEYKNSTTWDLLELMRSPAINWTHKQCQEWFARQNAFSTFEDIGEHFAAMSLDGISLVS
jgi:hypothetical protein